MSKTITINQIEQQIEALRPVEQIKMLERILRQLKRVLVKSTATQISVTDSKITEKLNHVYQTEASCVDSQILNAQFSSIGREVW